MAAPSQYAFNEGRGQVVCCLLAAHAMCQLPLDLDLTDGKQHHLLRLRGDLLLVYEGCTPTQVRQTFIFLDKLQKYQYQATLKSYLSVNVYLAFKKLTHWHGQKVLGPASSDICHNMLCRSRMLCCRHTMKWQTSLSGKAQCSQASTSSQSLQQSWRRNFVDPSRSSKD